MTAMTSKGSSERNHRCPRSTKRTVLSHPSEKANSFILEHVRSGSAFAQSPSKNRSYAALRPINSKTKQKPIVPVSLRAR